MEQEIDAIFEAMAEYIKQQNTFPSDLYTLHSYYMVRGTPDVNYAYFKRVGDRLLELTEGLEPAAAKAALEYFLRKSQMATKYNILCINPRHLRAILLPVRLRLHFHSQEAVDSLCRKIHATRECRDVLTMLRVNLYRDLREANKGLGLELYEAAWKPERVVKMIEAGVSMDDVLEMMF